MIGVRGDGVNDPGERNLIAGNAGDGVGISGIGTDANIVAGNFIGTNASGAAAAGNGLNGVIIFGGAKNNRIGSDANGVS